MAEMGKVADARQDARGVIDENRVSGYPDPRSVDEEELDAGRLLAFEERVGATRRHHDQSIHPAAEECSEDFALSFLTLV